MAKKNYQKLKKIVDDLFISFGKIIYKEVLKEFDSEHDGTWEELKPQTQYNRTHLGYPPKHPILKRSGSLRKSIGVFYNGTKIIIESNHFVKSINISDIHEEGKGNIPARPFTTYPKSCERGSKLYTEHLLFPLVKKLRKNKFIN
jgi:phage gpG-like protein